MVIQTESKKACLYLAPLKVTPPFPLRTLIELNLYMAPKPTSPASDPPSSEEIVKQLIQVLDDLKKEGKIIRIQICPKCKSPNIRGQETWYDIGGAMGISPPKFRCLRCGYWGRVILEATNEDLDERVLDELMGVDTESAQKLLNDINQQSTDNEDS